MGDSVENWRVRPTEKALDQTVRKCMSEKLIMTVGPTRNIFRIKLRLLYLLVNLQILRTGNSCHQRFARQTSSTAVTSDWFEV